LKKNNCGGMAEIFHKKDLSRQVRVGQCLRTAREKNGMSLKQIAKRTNITECYLVAIENGNVEKLPALIFQKNYVREFARAVGLDPEKTTCQYLEEEISGVGSDESAFSVDKKKCVRRYSNNFPLYARVFGMIGVFSIAMLYLGFQIKNIVEPPNLEIYTPTDGYVTDRPAVMVQGQTDLEIKLDINGKEIGNGVDGRFKEMVDLSEGVNIITVTAKKKHGKTTTLTNRVVFKPTNK